MVKVPFVINEFKIRVLGLKEVKSKALLYDLEYSKESLGKLVFCKRFLNLYIKLNGKWFKVTKYELL